MPHAAAGIGVAKICGGCPTPSGCTIKCCGRPPQAERGEWVCAHCRWVTPNVRCGRCVSPQSWGPDSAPQPPVTSINLVATSRQPPC
jgi:hypothetical protein